MENVYWPSRTVDYLLLLAADPPLSHIVINF